MLVALLILGSLLHELVAQQLRADSEALLRTRADIMVRVGSTTAISLPSARDLLVGMRVVRDAALPGFQIGGPATGTIAFIVGGDGSPFGDAGPDPTGIADALGPGVSTMRETVLERFDGVPVRAFTVPLDRDDRRFAVQVVTDRRTELRTLELVRWVLAIGGIAAIVAAGAAGWVFAGRALIPVRASMRRQREFTADASHELRTPLAVIRTNAELLERDDLDPAVARDALEDIRSEAARMGQLVDQLLLLARADAELPDPPRVPTDLAEAVASAAGSLGRQAAARHVALDLDLEPVEVPADPDRLVQLTTVLVDNAIKHAQDPGRVTVTVGRHGGGAILRVEDDGPGVRPEDRARVFDRFWRSPGAPTGGSGLGLAIAATIVRSLGGAIEVGTSRIGGAMFTVTLPVSHGDRPQDPRPDSASFKDPLGE